jgi:hypothetical protein
LFKKQVTIKETIINNSTHCGLSIQKEAESFTYTQLVMGLSEEYQAVPDNTISNNQILNNQTMNNQILNNQIMNKDAFWQTIEETKNIDTEKMYFKLTQKMKELPKEDVQKFRTYIRAYAGLATETIEGYMACNVIGDYASDDSCYDFTLWLISRGETVLLNALYDPDTLSELPWIPWGKPYFEDLMYVGIDESEDMDDEMYEKIIEEITPTIKFKYEAEFKKYEYFDDAYVDIPKVLPKLIKRAELEEYTNHYNYKGF